MIMPAGNFVTSQRLTTAVALCDSGSQIPVVSSRLLNAGDDDKMGTVNLQGVVGDAVTVPLMNESEVEW